MLDSTHIINEDQDREFLVILNWRDVINVEIWCKETAITKSNDTDVLRGNWKGWEIYFWVVPFWCYFLYYFKQIIHVFVPRLPSIILSLPVNDPPTLRDDNNEILSVCKLHPSIPPHLYSLNVRYLAYEFGVEDSLIGAVQEHHYFHILLQGRWQVQYKWPLKYFPLIGICIESKSCSEESVQPVRPVLNVDEIGIVRESLKDQSPF